MTSQPRQTLLTIAIPTFNRERFLRECLESILSERPGDEVEIVVSDNHSEDGTQALMEGYCREQRRIRYYRNAANLGPDANILNCLKRAKGSYVHLLCDDDLYLPSGLNRLLAALRREEPSFLFMNFCNFSGEFRAERCTGRHYPAERDLLFADKDQFLLYLNIYATFVSSMVFSKGLFDRVADPERFIGTRLSPAHLLVATVAMGEKYLVTAEPLIAHRGENSGGYNIFRVFACEWKEVLLGTGLRCGFRPSTMNRVFDITIRTFLRRWLVHTRVARTSFDSSGYQLLVSSTWRYPSAWLYLYPFMLMPAWLLRMVRRRRLGAAA